MLIRRQRNASAERRFEKIVQESPVFDRLEQKHGAALEEFLTEKVEVLSGDASQPQLGLDPAVARDLGKSLDLVVNSGGLTDFNPDLREALASNVDSVISERG